MVLVANTVDPWPKFMEILKPSQVPRLNFSADKLEMSTLAESNSLFCCACRQLKKIKDNLNSQTNWEKSFGHTRIKGILWNLKVSSLWGMLHAMYDRSFSNVLRYFLNKIIIILIFAFLNFAGQIGLQLTMLSQKDETMEQNANLSENAKYVWSSDAGPKIKWSSIEYNRMGKVIIFNRRHLW